MPLLLSTLLGAEPAPAASAPKAAKSKVYIVYVTVVEVDDDGNETVLFTPRVQTTGNPAGVTVDHVDGRSFEFNCKLASVEANTLERPPEPRSTAPAPPRSQPPLGKKDIPTLASGNVVAPTELRPTAEIVATAKSAPAAPPVSRKVDEFFVRTYDVADLIEQSVSEKSDAAADSDFAPLIKTLKAVAAPEGWSGKATIRPFASSKSLAIKQNEAGHKAVTQALEELRPRKIDLPEPMEAQQPK